jgi:adenylate cyclase
VPASPERLREELQLYVRLQAPLIATTGYSSAEVEKACGKARELCQQLNDDNSPAVFAMLGGLSSVYFNRGELRIAIGIAQQMLRSAERSDNRIMLLWAHYTMGFELSEQGENLLARDHLEQCIALYDRKQSGHYGFIQDPGPTALLHLAEVVERLGYPDLALQRALEGLEWARALAHPYTLGWVVGKSALIFMFRGDDQRAASLLEEQAELCTRYGFDELLEDAIVGQGHEMVKRGLAEAGIARIHEGLAIARNHRPFGLALLADAHRRAGQSEEGLAFVAEAFRKESECERRNFLAWLYQLKGQLSLIRHTPSEVVAEECFRQSIDVAHGQGDKSQELETTTLLARLLRDTGRRHEARTLLAEVYNCFTEGFDTARLKDAKALLDVLQGEGGRIHRGTPSTRGADEQ